MAANNPVEPLLASQEPKSSDNVDVQRFPYFARSFRLNVVNWWHVVMAYSPWLLYAVLAVVVAQVAPLVTSLSPSDMSGLVSTSKVHVAGMWPLYASVTLLVVLLLSHRSSKVYLVDFAVADPPETWKVSHEDVIKTMEKLGVYTPESLEFQKRLLAQGGLGQATHWPPVIHPYLRGETDSLDTSMSSCRKEAEAIIFGCVEELLKKTNTKAKQIDFLIINCSLFVPTPSLCAMVVHKFGMRVDTRTYNLGGMGCSAGLVSVDLAKHLLASRPGSLAMVVSTENITPNLYLGNQRSMQLQNTLFRCGGAAILLSNKMFDGFRAKYKLLHSIRTQNASEESLNCVIQTEDATGLRGVHLSKDITVIAGRALTTNLTLLGPLVLPLREQIKTVFVAGLERLTNRLRVMAEAKGWKVTIPKVARYVPNFKTGIHHFCIHAGGRAVIDGIEKNLQLSREDTEPSRLALEHFGNTSSSSIWYELRFIERKAGPRAIKKGQRVLQIAFGSGFKCNSAVWVRLR